MEAALNMRYFLIVKTSVLTHIVGYTEKEASTFVLFCCLFHFASINPVCSLDNAYLFSCDLADDTDSKAWAWEWLTGALSV